MRTLVIAILCSCLWNLSLRATELDQAVQAIVQASEKILQQTNYSWTSLSESAPGTLTWIQGPTEGRTEKEGATFVTLTINTNTISIAFQAEKSAIYWADQWFALAELSGDVAWIADRLKTYKRAADEALFLAQNCSDLRMDQDGVYTGLLNHDALTFLLSRGRQVITDTKDMKGTVKFFTKEDQLDKYAYRIEGPISFVPDQPQSVMDRTTTVTFKKLGETQVVLPREAVEKLK